MHFVCDSHSDESESDPQSPVPELDDKTPSVQVSHCVVVGCNGSNVKALSTSD